MSTAAGPRRPARGRLVAFETPPPGSGYDLVLRTAFADARLKPRQPATALRPVHPGTAVSRDNLIYEVVAVDEAPPRSPTATAWCDCRRRSPSEPSST